MPQNTIYSIVQTPDGYLWMTTLDGLVRFDGVKFTLFNKNNTSGIESNRFIQMVVDARGTLWLKMENGSITRYHQGGFQTFTADSLNGRVRQLLSNAEGSPVAFTDRGIIKWDGEKFVPYVPIAGETKDSAVWWSKNGALWYSNGQNVYRFKDGQTIEFHLPGDAGASYITKLFEDSRSRMWIGTVKSGLFMLENEKLTDYTDKNVFSGAYVSPRIEDRNGNVWIVTEQGAAIISPDDKISRITTGEGLSDNVLTSMQSSDSIYEDGEGSIWIGTLFRGLNRLSRQSVAFYSRKHGLQSDVINPIYQSRDENIWIGGNNLTRYASGSFGPVSGWANPAQTVTAIEQDSDGNLWFGNWGNVFYRKNGQIIDWTDKFNLKPNITDIHQDRQGNLWFASDTGLFRQQNGEITRYTKNEGLVSDEVKVIHESNDGTLWIGAYGGLSRLRNGAFTSFTTQDGLASNQVRSIYEDAENVLWIGSYDNGLTRLKDGKFTRYTSNDGLFNDGVFQILEDDSGNFWMSCNRGIYRVSKQQLNDYADGKISSIESIALGKADGLLETECNGGQQPAGIKTKDGKLWFPTQHGVAVITPNEIKRNLFAPPVVIESAKIDNEAVGLKDKIEMSPGKNNLEIAYTGLSFIKPELVRFRYKLEGQDTDWIEAGARRTAYYSYLSPGNYTFQVIAANSDGVWNTQGAKIRISVQPPFYKTWWFRISVLIVILGAAYLLYRRRINQLKRHRQTQEKLSQQLIESQEAERKRIASELHDGLGQSLVIIKNRALLGTMSPDDKLEAQAQFEEISTASSKALEEVREIAYNLRPYHLDRLGLKQSIEVMLESINDSTAINFAYDIMPIGGVFQKSEEVIIYRIIQECVNNIVKHSEATEASVLVYQGANGVTMTIEDNGRGFLPTSLNQGKGGLGLIGLEERVRILGGTLQIRSAPDNGTTIIIKELAKKTQ